MSWSGGFRGWDAFLGQRRFRRGPISQRRNGDGQFRIWGEEGRRVVNRDVGMLRYLKNFNYN